MILHHIPYFAVHAVDVLDDFFTFRILCTQQLNVLFIFPLLFVRFAGVLLQVGGDIFTAPYHFILFHIHFHARDITSRVFFRKSL